MIVPTGNPKFPSYSAVMFTVWVLVNTGIVFLSTLRESGTGMARGLASGSKITAAIACGGNFAIFVSGADPSWDQSGTCVGASAVWLSMVFIRDGLVAANEPTESVDSLDQ